MSNERVNDTGNSTPVTGMSADAAERWAANGSSNNAHPPLIDGGPIGDAVRWMIPDFIERPMASARDSVLGGLKSAWKGLFG